jgi:hypothetical protein
MYEFETACLNVRVGAEGLGEKYPEVDGQGPPWFPCRIRSSMYFWTFYQFVVFVTRSRAFLAMAYIN